MSKSSAVPIPIPRAPDSIQPINQFPLFARVIAITMTISVCLNTFDDHTHTHIYNMHTRIHTLTHHPYRMSHMHIWCNRTIHKSKKGYSQRHVLNHVSFDFLHCRESSFRFSIVFCCAAVHWLQIARHQYIFPFRLIKKRREHNITYATRCMLHTQSTINRTERCRQWQKWGTRKQCPKRELSTYTQSSVFDAMHTYHIWIQFLLKLA